MGKGAAFPPSTKVTAKEMFHQTGAFLQGVHPLRKICPRIRIVRKLEEEYIRIEKKLSTYSSVTIEVTDRCYSEHIIMN